jgi:PAS domain-containing protein
MDLYALGLEINLLLAAWLSLAAWQRDPATPGRVNFILLALAGMTWCAGELLEARSAVTELTADRVKYAGILTLPSLWLGVASHAARLEVASRVPWFPLVLLAPLGFAYGLLYSPSWGSIFLEVVDGGMDVRGPVWWIAALYNYALVVAGSGLLIFAAFRRRHPLWRGQLVLGMAACVPLAASAAYVADGLTWSHDPTPVLLGIALLALRSIVFSGGLLQMLPISQLDLLRQFPIGVLLTNSHGTVVSANPAAAARLGIAAEEAVGRDLDALLRSVVDAPDTWVTPLRSLDAEAGSIVLLDVAGKRNA